VTAAAVQYSVKDRVATIRIDDGKRNALSFDVLRQLHAAFARARTDRAAVIVTGRESVFSAGFDLKQMQRGGTAALRMLYAGYTLPARVMSHPYPVVAACSGHVFAMGVFLMLSADAVIGSRGDFRIAANEVAIGLTMPRVAATVLRHRLTPAAFQRAVTLSQYFDVDAAQTAGLFDEVVEPGELMPRAQARMAEYLELDQRAHAATKRRVRAGVIRRLRFGAPLDLLDAVLIGLHRTVSRR